MSVIEYRINQILDYLMLEYSDRVEQTKTKPVMLGWWVGRIMKELQGYGDPKQVLEIIRERFRIDNQDPLKPKLIDVREYVKELEK